MRVVQHFWYIIFVFLTGCSTKQPTLQQAIVYTTLRPEHYDIFILEENDSNPKRLTKYKGMDYNATFSPDNKWIVYTSEHNGNTDLYALENGKTDEESIRLTTNQGADDQASFSPDGKQIVYMSTRSSNASLWIMPFTSTAPSSKAEQEANPLTETKEYGEFNPVFSENGQHIAFSSNKVFIQKFRNHEEVDDTWTDIFVVDKDGKNNQLLTDSKAIYGSPYWNKEGTKLFYYKFIEGIIGAIVETDLLNKESKILTDTMNYVLSPVVNARDEMFYVQRDDSLTTLEKRRINYMDEYFYLVKMDANGRKKTILKTPYINYYHPRINAKNQILLHGNGPTEGMNKKSNGETFSRPESFREIPVENQKLFIAGVRGYGPTITADGKEIISGEWINDFMPYEKQLASPPIVSCDENGNHYRTLFNSKNCFAWTPVVTRDKKWIVFSCGARNAGAEQKVDIWKVKYDGSGAVNLTGNISGNNAFPDVSYDGKWIVFRNISKRKGVSNKEIYLMDSDGKNVKQMTNTPETETMPAISPDGKWIAYVRQNQKTNGMNICIQEVNNPNDKGVLFDANVDNLDMHPRFSPDGKWIVFVSTRAFMYDEYPLCGFNPQPYGEVFIKKIGSVEPPLQLTHDKWEDGLPFWGYYSK